MNSNRTGSSTFAIRTSPRPDQKLQKSLPLFHLNKNFNFFLPSLLKFFKTANAQPTRKDINSDLTTTAKSFTDLTFKTRTTERQLVTAPTRKQGFCASYDRKVLNLKFSSS